MLQNQCSSSTKVLYRVVPRMLDSEGYSGQSQLCSQEVEDVPLWGWRCVCVMAGGPMGCTSAFLAPELEDKWPPRPHCGLSSSSPSAPRLRVLFLVLYLNALTLFPGPLLSVVFSSSYFHLILNSYSSFKTHFKYHFLQTPLWQPQINKRIFFLCTHSYLQLSLA